MGIFALIVLGFIALVVLIGLSSAIRIINEYERGVLFRLGRLLEMKGPGLRLIIPFGIDRLVKIDLRTVTLEVPPQEVISLDNVTIKVNAVIYFLVVNPNWAVTRVANFINATSQIAQTTLRSVLGQSSLDELLANREKINTTLQRIIDEQTEPWGIKVSTVEIKDVELPSTMQRAMAKQAEAEREKRAKIIHAEGEFAASAAGQRRRSNRHPAKRPPAPIPSDAYRDRGRAEHGNRLPCSDRHDRAVDGGPGAGRDQANSDDTAGVIQLTSSRP